MKKELNKKLLFIITFLLIGVVVTIYATYAFYIADPVGNESVSTVAVTGGSLTINYQNNSGNIVAEKILPGWSATKSFTITATKDYNEQFKTDFKIWYDMLLVIDRNDFLTGSLEYLLSPISADVNKEGIFINDTYKPIPKGTNVDGVSMGSGYLPNDSVSHTYNLSLRYLDRDDIDQTLDMEGKFYARVNIKGSEQATLTIDLNGGTLTNFSLDSNNKSRIAKNSEIYIPLPIKEGFFSGWEIVSGSGTIVGNNLTISSSNVTIKAAYSTSAFTFDSWATIASNIKSGNTSRYNVGDTKEVAIDGFTNTEAGSNGLYTVRIANNSNYDCTLDSKTACGFVVEFVDIITTHNMNPAGTYNDTEYPYGTNLGGWPKSSMRDYIQNTLLGKLPSDLRNVIANTTVISGHGSADKNTSRTDGNWGTTDKLYLLSTGEIYSNCLTSNCYDTASSQYNGSGATTTRQLDYYNGVTTSANTERAIRQRNGASQWWWLRSASSDADSTFRSVGSGGLSNYAGAFDTGGGLAPAFRIG